MVERYSRPDYIKSGSGSSVCGGLQNWQVFPIVDTVRAGLLFVVCEDLVRSTYEQYEADTLWDKWMDNFQTMETAYKVDVWNPKPSGLCRQWCQVMECPHNGRR